METITGEPLAQLRHELRTPINHILGYTELLIEDAGERHLEAFVPVFQQIHDGGRQLLESIQTTLAAEIISARGVDLQALKTNLRRMAKEVLATSTSLLDDLESGNRQTLSDLHAISLALHRLVAFTGEEGAELVKRPSSPVLETDRTLGENISAHGKKPDRKSTRLNSSH